MAYSFPTLEAVPGRGFAHEIVVKGSIPRELIANVEGDPGYWPLAKIMAAAPELVAAAIIIYCEVGQLPLGSLPAQLIEAMRLMSAAIAKAEGRA